MAYRKHEHEGYFGDWLDDMMFDNDLCVEQLAALIGLSTRSVIRHANMKVKPNFARAKKYADFFGWDRFEVYELMLKDFNGLTRPSDILYSDEDEELDLDEENESYFD